MNAPTTNTLQVPGASLHYEVRGAGPVLLLIVGGNGDSATFERLATELADRYRVITYDRRGFSRSPLEGPVDQDRLGIDTDDAHRLLSHLTEEPAYVLGSSSGAIVALDLVTRHPEQVRTVVAHEPPAVTLLPDAGEHLAFFDEVHDTFRRHGTESAMRTFAAGVGLDDPPEPPPQADLPAPMAEMMSRIRANFDFFLEHEMRQYPRFVPDVAALKTVSTLVVLAGGCDSREHVPYRPNVVLAERLGHEVVDFPGGHVGYVTHSADFAAKLNEVLTD
jgi:acetyltransferase/esterase